jgi:molybdopterin-biosynthesis enzyme MoeA-like protein
VTGALGATDDADAAAETLATLVGVDLAFAVSLGEPVSFSAFSSAFSTASMRSLQTL